MPYAQLSKSTICVRDVRSTVPSAGAPDSGDCPGGFTFFLEEERRPKESERRLLTAEGPGVATARGDSVEMTIPLRSKTCRGDSCTAEGGAHVFRRPIGCGGGRDSKELERPRLASEPASECGRPGGGPANAGGPANTGGPPPNGVGCRYGGGPCPLVGWPWNGGPRIGGMFIGGMFMRGLAMADPFIGMCGGARPWADAPTYGRGGAPIGAPGIGIGAPMGAPGIRCGACMGGPRSCV